MREYAKYIIAGCLTLVIVLSAILFFASSYRQNQKNIDIEIYNLIPSDLEALIAVNRPKSFATVLNKDEAYRVAIGRFIPQIYLEVMEKATGMQVTLLSFHKESAILYAKVSPKQANQIEQKIIKERYGMYAPESYMDNEIQIMFYPVDNENFIGFYYHQGVFVMSHSKKLLDNVAARQSGKSHTTFTELDSLRKGMDTKALFNLMIPYASLTPTSERNQSNDWVIGPGWGVADFFTNDFGQLCYYSTWSRQSDHDEVYYNQLAEVLSMFTNYMIPEIRTINEITFDTGTNTVYLNGCIHPN